MDLEYFSKQLKLNAKTVENLVNTMENEEARWRSAPDKWSVLEVVNHLLDEEKNDFPLRLKFMLYYPEKTWPSIDPVSWVIENNYNDRDIVESLNNFLSERNNSIKWLSEIIEPNWDSEYAASWGKIKAGDMFCAWVNHDLLHLRQILELKYLYNQTKFGNFNSDYAGKW